MKSYSFTEKITLSLLIILSIVIIFADIFHYQIVQKNRVILEENIRYPKLNIDSVSKITKNIIFNFHSAFNNIELNQELLNDNNHLKHRINLLEEQNNGLEMKFSFMESHSDIYKNYAISSARIFGDIKAKDFMVIIEGPTDNIKINDFIINSCGILGKITHIGNNNALVMSLFNKKFNLPVSLGDSSNKILGVYNSALSQIQEINDKSNIFTNMEVFTMEQTGKIPCCILVGKINYIDNGKILMEPNFCSSELALILSYQSPHNAEKKK